VKRIEASAHLALCGYTTWQEIAGLAYGHGFASTVLPFDIVQLSAFVATQAHELLSFTAISLRVRWR